MRRVRLDNSQIRVTLTDRSRDPEMEMSFLTSFPKTDSELMAELRASLAREQAQRIEAEQHDCRRLDRIDTAAGPVYGEKKVIVMLQEQLAALIVDNAILKSRMSATC